MSRPYRFYKRPMVDPGEDYHTLSPHGERLVALAFLCPHGYDVCNNCVGCGACPHECGECQEEMSE